MISREEELKVSEAMIKYGGSFIQDLGKAVLSSDHINKQKIKDTWPEYWEQYLKMGN